MFKETLIRIAANDYSIPEGEDEYALVLQIVGVLGSPDPELRDELGYTILSKWLLDRKILQHDQLTQLLKHAISEEMLFKGIGEADTDSVFSRSFSSLLIALLLYRDNQERFLDESSINLTMNRIVSYCKQEKDFRGYAAQKGWAHAAAHVADAVDECVRSRFTGPEDCRLLFNGLMALIDHAPTVFNAEEDERIATAVTAMVELGKVPLPVVCEWLMQIDLPATQDIQSRYRRINFKHFVRCLWIRFMDKGWLTEENELLSIERRFNPYRNV